jgi:tRNA(Ile)-lysidine synthase
LVGVSGGCDSMSLLHVLKRAGADVIACHVNYGLRGPDSQADEALVRVTAAAWDIPVRVEQVRLPSGNVQDGARRARRAYFQRLMTETGATVVFLAHHQDDQVETILLQWLRGGRLDALTGMAVCSGPYRRPWLDVPAAAIREYARTHGLSWREDRSNADRRYLRNRIRMDILPGIDRQPFLDLAAVSRELGLRLDQQLLKWTDGPTLSDALFASGDAELIPLVVHRFARKANLRVSDAECALLMAGRPFRPGKRVGPFVREAAGWSLVIPEPPPPVPDGHTVRRWEPGDVLDGRKVSDRMSDAKWPHWMRLGAWVVLDAAGRVVSLRKPVSSGA